MFQKVVVFDSSNILRDKSPDMKVKKKTCRMAMIKIDWFGIAQNRAMFLTAGLVEVSYYSV